MNSFISVNELIKELKKYPQDYKVLVDGYEGGLDTVISSEIINIEFDENKAWYYGPFEEVKDSEDKAIKLISTRGSRN
jgi:hypothetical protein